MKAHARRGLRAREKGAEHGGSASSTGGGNEEGGNDPALPPVPDGVTVGKPPVPALSSGLSPDSESSIERAPQARAASNTASAPVVRCAQGQPLTIKAV
jgi:hypothetical protein